MAKTNYKKFLEIEEMMKKAKSLMSEYERILKERYDYMNELRGEYSKLSHAIGKVQQRLSEKKQDLDGDVKAVLKDAIRKIDTQIEALQEEIYEDVDAKVNKLIQSKELLQSKFHKNNIVECLNLLNEVNVNIEEVNVLKEYVESMGNTVADVKEYSIKKIEKFRNDYMSSFVSYRGAIEEGENTQQKIVDIISELDDSGFSQEAELLIDAKPNIDEDRIQRPESEELLNLLKPIRSAGLKYFQSNNNKSESYDLNIKFADEIRNTRRSLMEGREYIGTKNAFERLREAYDALYNYMYERYHQLNGTPKNYHGHDSRKKK